MRSWVATVMPCSGAGSPPSDSSDEAAQPEDAVRLLAAVQSQEYAHAFWSLGMRTRGSTFADVKSAFDEGRILRTHMLRTTWHFVTPEDIRWILATTSPRVLTAFGSHFRGLGLDTPHPGSHRRAGRCDARRRQGVDAQGDRRRPGSSKA